MVKEQQTTKKVLERIMNELITSQDEQFTIVGPCASWTEVWELSCAGFRHSASLHARVILDGAACRLRELRDVRDILGVLGVALVVPIVLRVLVS